MKSLTAYQLLSPRKVVFGWGRRAEVGSLARYLGTRALIVSGSRTLETAGVVDQLATHLRDADLDVVRVQVPSREPLVEDVDDLIAKAASHGFGQPGDFVIGIGGGAALDLAKSAAALAPQSERVSVVDYLEGVGRGLTLAAAPLPILAIPTTAGTGSEATKNAVISSHDPKFKKSLRDERLVPACVLIDPELTVTTPKTVTAHSGMDALTQLIESFLSKRANPLTQSLCLEGLRLGVPALRTAVENGADQQARSAMSQAAFLSGVALANSGLGMAHGVAAALGVHANVPHGLACAVMLPVALRTNADACSSDMQTLAEVIVGRPFKSSEAAAEAVIHWSEELAVSIGIPRRLSEIGVLRDTLDDIVQSSRGNSMNGNPKELSDEELKAILEAGL
ncbi:iron-containing alcohol dehydrogenase [Thalassoroseus pseudoceratinae]|uniref:iron-containing alcohol dehydrogenase n=1 Tax=Thalassoroseus pseudoceratinae TaxID=2713176 RepID=UPI00141DA9DC|nr:iron-containing alcohol dehydrogenase [Thalassoroseus pseudoceratinae]